jgi:hypothetical protein
VAHGSLAVEMLEEVLLLGEVELELGEVSRDFQVSAYVTGLTCADALLAVVGGS